MKKIILLLLGFLTLSGVDLSAANRYWVGGTGTWNEVTHWSEISGGIGGSSIPTIYDDVFFDQNSFSFDRQTVMVTADAFCHSIDWSLIDDDAVFSAASTEKLTVTGSYSLSPRCLNGFKGQTVFGSNQAGNTIITADRTIIGNWVFDGSGSWTFGDDVSTETQVSISLIKGNLNTNGKKLTVGSFIGNSTSPRCLNLTSSEIIIKNSWDCSSSANLYFSCGTSHMFFNEPIDDEHFKKGNLIYNPVSPLQTFCVTQGTAALPCAANLIITLSGTNVTCNGLSNGTATVVSVTGGSGNYTYEWQSPCTVGCNSTTLSGLAAGTYTIKVTDNVTTLFCYCNISITAPGVLLVYELLTIPPSCNSKCDGFSSVGTTGGNLIYSYLWKTTTPAKITDTAQNLCAATYTVHVTDNKGCSDSTIIIIGQPNVLLANGTKTNVLCNGAGTGTATVAPTGGTGPYTYSWNTIPIKTSASITNLLLGTYVCTITDARGCTATYSANITQPAAAITATVAQTNVLCSGGSTGSATVTPSGGTGAYHYSWNTLPIQTTQTATGLAAGSYTCTITDDNNCSITKTVTITTLNTTPVATATPATQTICSGGTAVSALTSTVPGTTFAWTASASSVSITGFTTPGSGNISDVITNSGITQGTVTYTITPTGPAPSSCPGIPITFVITVNPKPIVTNAPLTQSICSGGSTTLVTLTSNVASTTFAWTASATAGVSGFTASGTNTIPVQTISTTGTTAGTVTYVITPTGPAPSLCPGISSNYVVTVYPKPTVTNAPLTQSICSGGSTTLVTLTSNVASSTFVWTASGTAGVSGFTASGTGTIPVQTISTTGTTAGTVTYTVIPTGPAPSSCPGTSVNYIVTVYPKPTVTNAPLTQSICSGGNTTLVTLASNIAGTTFAWTASATAGVSGFTASGTGTIPVQTISTTGTTVGTVTYTIMPTGPAPSLCPGTPVDYVITVIPKPTISNSPLTQSVCSGGNTTLVTLTSNVAGTTFAWTASATAGVSGFTASGTGTIPVQTISTTGTTAGTITYIVTPTGPAPSSCPGTSSNYVITVYPKPTVTNAPLTQSICSGGSTTLVTLTSNIAGTTFAWTASATAGVSGFTASGTGTIPVQMISTTGTTAGTVTYIITPTGPAPSSCIGIPVNYVVTVNPKPIVTNTLLTQSICSGGSTTLVTLTSDVAGTTFAWTASATAGVSGFTASGTGTIPVQTISTTGTTAGTVTYIVIPTGPAPSSCPGTPSNYVVAVYPKPTVTNAPLTQSICSGGSTTLVTLTSNVTGTTFSWTASATAGVSGFAASGTGTIPVQTISTTGTTAGTVTYIVTPTGPAPSSCPGTSANYVITVYPKPTITNAPLTQSICSGGNTTLVTLTSNIASTTFAWTASATAGVSGFTASGTGTIPLQTISTTGTTAGTVTFTIIPTGPAPSLCPGTPVDYVITVIPKPTVSNSPLAQSVCSGGSTTLVTLTSNVASTTFSWTASATAGVSGFTASGTGTIPVQTISTTGTTAGTITYIITPTGPAPSSCPGISVNYVVTVYPKPTVTNAPLAQSICSGANTTMVTLASNITGTTFSWTTIATAGVSGFTASGTGTIPVQTISTTGTTVGTVTYFITPTGPAPSSCAGTPVNYVITVYPMPTVTNSPLTQSICSGGSTTLVTLTSNVASTTFAWTASATAGVSGFTASGTGTIPVQTISTTGTTAGTVTYTIIPTGPAPSSCPGTPTNYVVTVYPKPTVTNAPLTQSICSGGSTTLVTLTSNVASTTFAWTASATAGVSGFTASGAGTIPVQTISTTGITPGTVTYTIIPTGPAPSSCPGTSVNYVITVNPTPVEIATPTLQTICSGDTTSIALTSNVIGTSFGWTVIQSNVSGASAGNGNLIAQVLTSTTNVGTAVYTITPTVNGCAGLPVSVTITVNPVADVTTSTSLQSICSGTNTSIALISNEVGTSFDWTVISMNVLGASAGSGNTIVQTLTATALFDTVVYTITPTFNGCPGTPIKDTVTVIPTPVATATPALQTICSGLPTSIALTSDVVGTVFDWTVIATNVSGSSAGNGNTIGQTLTSTGVINGTAIYTIIPSFNLCAGIPITVPVTVRLPIGAAIDTTISNCGICAGSINVTPNSGTSPYTFTWLPLPGTLVSTPIVSSANALCAGVYNVTVTDNNGCNSQFAVGLDNSNGITGEIITKTDITCMGGCNGTGSVIPIGGTAPYTYLWNDSPPAASATTDSAASSLCAGSYLVKITDFNGCIHNSSVTINQPSGALTGIITSQTNIPCSGDGAVGSVTVLGINGTPGYSYSKNGGAFQANGTFNGLSAGLYTITVKDTNGCPGDVPVTITEPAITLTGLVFSQTNVMCKGDSTGCVTVAASDGTPNYSFSKDGSIFQVSGTFCGLSAGSYIITVKDANGCTDTVHVTISQPATKVMGTITSQTDVFCKGDSTASVQIVGSLGTGATYLYSIYSVSNYPVGTFYPNGTFNNLLAGIDTVVVMDSLGCRALVPVTITEPATVVTGSILSQTNVFCKGDTTGCVTILGGGGTSGYSYSKDGVVFQGGNTFCNLFPASHIITVKDVNGCTDTVQVTITEPALALSASIASQINVLCKGDTTGCVTISSIGGTGIYVYSKDGVIFQASNTICGLLAGSHTITVKDATDCTDTVHLNITEPLTALSASAISQTNVLCKGDTTGCITIAGVGGIPGYSYSINGVTFLPGGTFCNLKAGIDTIKVKDANGCVFDAAFTILEPLAALSGSITSQTNVLCNGGSTGCVTVVGNGGTPGYAYSINGVTFLPSGTFCNLPVGNDTVRVKDSNGCTFDVFVTITETDAVTGIIIAQSNVICMGGGSVGSVTIAGSNGTPGYMYSKNGGVYQTSGTFISLASGFYTITVKDTNGCTGDVMVTITEPLVPVSGTVTAQSNIPCFGNGNVGSFAISGINGTPGYTYSNNGAAFQASGSYSGLASGTYTLTVKDTNGCTGDVFVTITEPAVALNGSITSQTDALCLGSNTGTVTISGNDGTPGYTYSDNGGSSYQVSGSFSNLAAGSYTITVKDTNGCTFDVPVSIGEPLTAVSGTLISQTDVLCYGSNTGSVTVIGSGGTPGYTYSNNGGFPQVDGTFNDLLAGVYTITVTDTNGCTFDIPATIIEPPSAVTGTIVSQTNVLCNGNNSGSVTVEGSNGIPGYTYSIDGGSVQIDGTFNNLTAGTYNITVTDNNGCTVDVPIVITELLPLDATTAIIPPSDCGICDGVITISPTTGVPPYTFTWVP